MKIPKRFRLLGMIIDVVLVPTLSHKEDVSGFAIYRQNKIEIQPCVDGCPRTPDQIGHTFCHELMHFIFYFAAEGEHKDLHRDELLVNRCAGLLHQALTTMEYEEATDD